MHRGAHPSLEHLRSHPSPARRATAPWTHLSAGDAAHIHSPFGGQGMNTGLHDVWNFAWKLDLFRGNERLLDSYRIKRLPVIKSVIDTTHFLTRVMSGDSLPIRDVRGGEGARSSEFIGRKLSALGVCGRP